MNKKISKKQQLTNAALDLFMEKGFEKTTIDDIVNRANCGKGTFYRYFANKEALFEEVDEAFLTAIESTLKSKCQNNLEPRSYLLAGLEAFLEAFSSNDKIGLVRFERDMRLNPEERKISSKKVLKNFYYMKDYLEQAKSEGKIKPFNSETILMNLLGAAHFYLFREFKLGTPYTSNELEETIDIIFYGVAANE